MVKKVRNDVVLKIKKLLYNRGYVIERSANEDQLFIELHTPHDMIQRSKLKARASKDRFYNNHRHYNNLLKRFVPDLNTNFTSSEFIGSGLGEYNLCVYRKVSFQNNIYFEKVYFNDSYALLKNEWIYEHIYPVLEDYLNTAKLYKVIRGELITIIYFEFIEPTHFSKEEWRSIFVNMSKKGFELSKDFENLIKNAPCFLKDYTLHDYYIYSIKSAEKAFQCLSKGELTTKEIEEIVKLQPLKFTHGDIHHGNVLTDSHVVDWDNFGFFPHGFESAFIFTMCGELIAFRELQEILITEYAELVHEDEWEGFELSCLYFYFVFISMNTNTDFHLTLQLDLFERIKELYRNYINKQKKQLLL